MICSEGKYIDVTGNTNSTTTEFHIWIRIKNYEMIEGAQLSNSFILLMILNEAKGPLTTTQISELISKRSKGEIYKISATLRDSLEHSPFMGPRLFLICLAFY